MKKKPSPTVFHTTKRGKVYLSDSLEVMTTMKASTVDLIVTSPPFGLTRKESGRRF